ncbi:hypothetical protein MM26B8_04660 [Mycoplasmopsis meleagridis]|uniref:Uncharacterized protein n=1 Tax=Mycoplasmopsis meleagridis ATCC 25294 TaxID=1264554 RepID=A0A0F5H077_9BACT|nr:hypothetical protein [Mycoplasmopsis meleagridis]KKB26726.1 hypothetical protein MMELEA_01080 [Mycoplasmopsis meleagridis ATCC 25294]KUH47576.1 hypothetical protein ASB56_00355 [Mycoplasmopsis meleagridis]OAD18158.1 hypothetical protein MM26B8_04660 [Mycoplasmopsis meleagridis]VEU77259.1 Uncharacterised protein [Mycoplasmopsis meleagridis]
MAKKARLNKKFDKDLYHYFTDDFKKILNCLNETDRYIIVNEFLYQTQNKEWYKERFSKSCYYTKRKKAIANFLYYFNL